MNTTTGHVIKLTTCQCCGSNSLIGLNVGLKEDTYAAELQTGGLHGWSLCTNCAFVFQNPRCSRETQENYYTRSAYRKSTPTPISQGYIDYAPHQLVRFNAWLQMQGVNLGAFQNANCLDYGCGIGGALNVLAERGNRAYGVELDDHLRTYGNTHYKIEIVPRVEELPANIQWNMIFTHNAVEHIYDPNDFFTFAAEKIHPQGVLIVVVPAWRNSNTTITLDDFNASHDSMWDHIALSRFMNNHGFFMTSYLYSNPAPDGDWEICATAIKSARKNYFSFSPNEVVEELYRGIPARSEERTKAGTLRIETQGAIVV